MSWRARSSSTTTTPPGPLEPSTPIFLTGSLAQSVPTEPLEALAQYPFEPLLPPLDYPPDLPMHTYAVNIGLALKEV
jgi:hypothetical protein